MAQYRKKPVVIEAVQWSEVTEYVPDEPRIVDYYRNPSLNGGFECNHCGKTLHNHGWINTLEGGHIVCPGDWIVTGIKGEHYPVKPDIFEQTYEAV